MTLTWKRSEKKRPSCYLDWQHQNVKARGDDGSSGWCSVMIEIRKLDGSYLKNLETLRDEIWPTGFGSMGNSSSSAAMRMQGDEFDNLEKLIKDIGQPNRNEPTNVVGVWFFIYLQEKHIYDQQGGFANKCYYDIKFAGPPIEGFNSGPGSLMPTQIDNTKPTPNNNTAIGIIDDGIAFAHERFRNADTTTRVKAIWLQSLETPAPGSGVKFGKVLNEEAINKLIKKHERDVDIYRNSELLDFGKENHKALSQAATHGTHVLDVAAGFDPKSVSNLKDHPIFAVQLPAEATADTSGMTMGSYVIQAIRVMMLWADNHQGGVPLVINFSYGILAGLKDGSHDLEWIIDELIAYRNNDLGLPTSLVLPAGNSYQNRDTAKLTLADQTSENIGWMIPPNDLTSNYLEIWFKRKDTGNSNNAPPQIKVTPPVKVSGSTRMPSNRKVNILERGSWPIAAIYYDKEATVDYSRIFIAINPTHGWENKDAFAPAGLWNISIKNNADTPLEAMLYIQRDDTPNGYPLRNRRSYFVHDDGYERDEKTGNYTKLGAKCPITHSSTLSAIANGKNVFVVGAAQDTDSLLTVNCPPPADYTSSGPTLGKASPDVSAIADEGYALWGILGAGTYSGSVVRLRGTSVAAPQLTRLLAYGSGVTKSGICGMAASWPTHATYKPQLGKCVLKPTAHTGTPPRKYPIY